MKILDNLKLARRSVKKIGEETKILICEKLLAIASYTLILLLLIQKFYMS